MLRQFKNIFIDFLMITFHTKILDIKKSQNSYASSLKIFSFSARKKKLKIGQRNKNALHKMFDYPAVLGWLE